MLFRPISISLMVFRCESTFTDFENSLRLSIQVKYTHSSTVVILSFLFPCPPISPFNVYFRLNHNANYYFWNRTYRIPKCIASVLTFKQKTDKEREQKKKTIFQIHILHMVATYFIHKCVQLYVCCVWVRSCLFFVAFFLFLLEKHWNILWLFVS